ncbi:MAG TPA: DUF4870 domain-containing protein [Ktedonobacteraceae bacterium]|jgi:uncharacterized membrane protein
MGQDPNQPYSGPYGQPQSGAVPPQGGYQGGYQGGGYQQPNPGYQQPNPGYQQPNPGYQQPNPGYQYQQPYGQPQGMYNAANALGPTSMNMEPNVAAGVSYIVGWITGLIFFLLEKQNRFVRFHAMQSIILSVAATVLTIVLDGFSLVLSFTFLGCLFVPLLSLVGIGFFVLWLICLINAFQGKYFKLPIIGDMAERWANPGMPAM